MTWAAFERHAYQAARSWGVAPPDFWRLSMAEWWAEFDSQVAQNRRLKEITEGGQTRGKFTEAQWAKARARHKERMDGRTRSP